MDYVGVKVLGAGGEVVGERRFLGLFTSKAQNTPVDSIPILRRKLRQVLELDEAVPGSHDYKAIVAAFNSLPREELFGADPDPAITVTGFKVRFWVELGGERVVPRGWTIEHNHDQLDTLL